MADNELHTIDQILALADGGDFLSQLKGDHRNMILAMHQHQMQFGGNAKASVSIKITYTLDHKLNMKMTAVADVKPPKEPIASAIAWTSADGYLTPENPQQMKMELRDAGTTKSLRSAGRED